LRLGRVCLARFRRLLSDRSGGWLSCRNGSGDQRDDQDRERPPHSLPPCLVDLRPIVRRRWNRPSVPTRPGSACLDRCRVRGGEAQSDVARKLQGLALRERTLRQPLLQRLALEQLYDRIGRALVGSEIVDRENVRMRQSRDRLRLSLEARQRRRVSSEVRQRREATGSRRGRDGSRLKGLSDHRRTDSTRCDRLAHRRTDFRPT
jgi:hypothetical protein